MNLRDELRKARKVISKQKRSDVLAAAKSTEKNTWDHVRSMMENMGEEKVEAGVRVAGSRKSFLARLARSVAVGLTVRTILYGAGVAPAVAAFFGHEVVASGMVEAFADAGEDFADGISECWDMSDMECDPSDLSDVFSDVDVGDLADAASEVFDSVVGFLGSFFG
jgi:hypothetical protein